MPSHKFVMLARASLASLALALPAGGAEPPAPTEGDFVLRDFRFASGEAVPELRLHYRTLGAPRKDAKGVVRYKRIGMFTQENIRDELLPKIAEMQRETGQ